MDDFDKPTTGSKPVHQDDAAQTFAPPKKATTSPTAEPASPPQVVKSQYQPSGADPYFGKGGLYELDPETGERRPRQPKQ